MFKKNVYPLMTMLLLATIALTACGAPKTQLAATPTTAEAVKPTAAAVPTPTTAPAAAPASLNVWIEWGDNPAQIQALFDKYTAQSGVKVVVTAPVEIDKIMPALTGSEPPDILVRSGGDLVKSYAKEGLIVQLNDAIKTGGIDINDFYAAPLDQCKVGDQIWCLPWGTDIYALFWNKDMFKAAGLDPNTPPQTMEQLVEFADKLTKVGGDGNIQQIGFIPDQAWGHQDLYARMFGGFWYNDDGTKLTANSQPMIDSLTWEQQFYSKYGFDQVLAFATGFGDQYMSPDYPFYTGKLAMLVDGEWQTGPNFISKFKPELSYGVAPFPYPADHPERANTGVVQGTVAVIPANAKNQEASAKLLAWMMSPAIVAEEMCFNANLPTSKIAGQDPCFTNNPKFKVFLDLMGSKNAYYIITSPISIEYNDAYALVEEQVLHTGADPKPLLDQLQADYEPKLEEALQK
jgi:multiple sugar transport system substrate-binding protein